ncbi:SUMF1/EgtB/PvdO family nonheme iron enzyme [Phaeobacter sp. QD34_3]|uniref:formylglycine-generating enzyme family protein n=1 Tax=unclassified Phaeobacter TaxID=2621772 RepID=UPI00237F7A39|nr:MULTISPECIES: SUMF1/EgtB/PvdO family nonheme iron enzyme [unclassified Phaeobacter]MDE4133251.1 SUMF1/EgtB/PvdO family nonheme iron enzyme [Phaeobacter sp. QD34_3]MDE4136962.1 SUMF1/EgtB/PvdO family nonheme iron enzyme [Phaeobacter sp. QD34_24]
MREFGADIDWITIPGGAFIMGSDDPALEANVRPAHRAETGPFQIARSPLTVAGFARFVKATGYRTEAEQDGWSQVWTGQIPEDVWPDNDTLWVQMEGACWHRPRGDDDVRAKALHPVTHLSYRDATAYCDWIGARLPTETEWELAARGADGQRNPWGDAPPGSGDCNCAMQVGDTTPVGAYPAATSPFGLLDAVGNAWEWTSSRYLAYPIPASEEEGRIPEEFIDDMMAEFAIHAGVEDMVTEMRETGQLPQAFRALINQLDIGVIRGGSFYSNCEPPERTHVTCRVYAPRNYRCFDLGLRPARDV